MMEWSYWTEKRRLRAEVKRLEDIQETLLNSNRRLMDENKRAHEQECKQYGQIRALQDDVSIAGQNQMEIQAKLDALRLSIKEVRRASFLFLEFTEDPMECQDPEPPPPADNLDKLRDIVGVKRDGSDVRRGDPKFYRTSP